MTDNSCNNNSSLIIYISYIVMEKLVIRKMAFSVCLGDISMKKK